MVWTVVLPYATMSACPNAATASGAARTIPFCDDSAVRERAANHTANRWMARGSGSAIRRAVSSTSCRSPSPAPSGFSSSSGSRCRTMPMACSCCVTAATSGASSMRNSAMILSRLDISLMLDSLKWTVPSFFKATRCSRSKVGKSTRWGPMSSSLPTSSTAVCHAGFRWPPWYQAAPTNTTERRGILSNEKAGDGDGGVNFGYVLRNWSR